MQRIELAALIRIKFTSDALSVVAKNKRDFIAKIYLIIC